MLWDGAAAERAGEGLGCRDRTHDQIWVYPAACRRQPVSPRAHGDRVELRGFGVFSIRARGARVGRNPRTGDEVAVPSKIVPHFRPGKELHERLNLPDGPAAPLDSPRK